MSTAYGDGQFVTVFLGSRMHALGILGHDGAHYASAKSNLVNEWANNLLCFWPLLITLRDFRRFHFEHHQHFNTDKDPELLFKNKWSRRQWQLPATRARITLYFLSDLLGFGVLEAIKMMVLVGKIDIWSWIGPLLWWGIVGGLLFKFGFELVMVIWGIAFCTSFWGIYRLRTWTEHVGTDSTHRVRANWWQKLIITPHGSWSHYEHHLYPSIPFWQRHKLRGVKTATVGIGELFSWYGRCGMDT
jgi:fatty acid desaturase